MRRSNLSSWVTAVGIAFIGTPAALAQPQEGGREIPSAERKGDGSPSEAAREATDRAVQLLLESDLQDPAREAAVKQLAEQVQPLLPSLSEEQRARLRQSLAKQTANSAQLTFGQLKTAVTLLEGIGEPQASIQNLVEAWLKVRPIDRLRVDEAQFCLLKSLPRKEERRSFTATWTGRLVPPSTGDYVFSTTPINVNQPLGRGATVRHSVRVSLNGQPVLEAMPDKWAFEGTPVRLQARQAIPIRVDVEYDAAASADTSAAPPSALLFWAGPGFGRSIVSPQALFLPTGNENGVLAEYRWEENQQPVAVSQPSRSIDFAWQSPGDIAPRNPDLVARLTNHLWQLATSPDYLGRCASGELTHVFLQDVHAATYLSSDQRRQFLQILVQQANLLGRASGPLVLQAYRAFRFGAEEDALDMLGQWMQLNADVAPEVTTNFFRENRQLYAELAIHLARQLPDHYRLLQERYLEMPDGRCALPAAYTLTYSYRSLPPVLDPENRSATVPATEWFQLLEAKANDESLSGNARVNWLIARAQEAESGIVSSGRAGPTENYLAGLPWLNEAQLVGDDDATRARIFREKAARLVAKNREKQLSELLDSAAGKVPPAELQNWSQTMAAVSKARRERIEADAIARRNAYLTELQRRRERAADRNDSQGVARYDSLIQRAGTVSE